MEVQNIRIDLISPCLLYTSENMPIKSAKIVAEKLPAMIQKAFWDYADCKVGFNRAKKRDNE